MTKNWLRETYWRWETYREYSPSYDHDHCGFCGLVIAEVGYPDPSAVHQSWITTFLDEGDDPQHEWACAACFERLRKTFDWYIVGAGEIKASRAAQRYN